MDRPQSPDSARTSLAKTRGLRTHFLNFEKGTEREGGEGGEGGRGGNGNESWNPRVLTWNQGKSGSELKTSNRRFKMDFAQRF